MKAACCDAVLCSLGVVGTWLCLCSCRHLIGVDASVPGGAEVAFCESERTGRGSACGGPESKPFGWLGLPGVCAPSQKEKQERIFLVWFSLLLTAKCRGIATQLQHLGAEGASPGCAPLLPCHLPHPRSQMGSSASAKGSWNSSW